MSIEAVVFDLDGVILDSEQVWDDVRHDFAVSHGGHWDAHDQPAVMGANSMQWAERMREHNGVDMPTQQIYEAIIGDLCRRYERDLPLIPGTHDAIIDVASSYSLGVASSSPRELIEYALYLAGLRTYFRAVVSSDDVARGKPAPDVYREACARLGKKPDRAAAVEDSANGIRSGYSAGLAVIAVPNPAYPPTGDALELADVVLGSISELTRSLVASLRRDT